MPTIQRDLPILEIDPRLSPHDDCQLLESVHNDGFFNGDTQTRNDIENRGSLADELDDCFTFIRTPENSLISDMNQMESTHKWESGPWVGFPGDHTAVDQTVEFHESDARHGERMLAMEIDGYEMVRSASMSEGNAFTPGQVRTHSFVFFVYPLAAANSGRRTH